MEQTRNWRAASTRLGRVHKRSIGSRRFRAAVAAGAMVAVVMPAVSSDAAVGGNRSIEVTTTSDLVILDGYPAGAKVKITAHRGGVVVGSAIKRVKPDGSIEMNHTGGTDCWESARTPNLRPGDRIRTKIIGTRIIDSMIVRGLFIDTVDRGASSVTVSGHVNLKGATGVPTGPLELRVRTDSDDVRRNVRGILTESGAFTREVPVPANEGAGSEVVLEWISGGGGELTVAEEAGPAQRIPGCPRVEAN
jgi:hypothetical protein